MVIDVSWRSQAGVRTDDNRDHGGLGMRGDEVLCVIADGYSTSPDSGALARSIISALIDWFIDCNQAMNAEVLLAQLPLIHKVLSQQYSRASASYLIVNITSDGTGFAAHAGDCLLGERNNNGELAWLTRPNALANAVSEIPIAAIAQHPARHRLTRSFRYREYMAPAIDQMVFEKELVTATDGF